MKNKTGTGGSPDWGAVHRVRLGHVHRFLRYRWGPVLPDDDAGYEDLRILLHVVANACKPENRVRKLANVAGTMAPWMPSTRVSQVAEEIAAKPLKVTSQWLGKALGVTADVRERLKIWQIAACDLTPEQAKERRRERERERSAKRRRENGIQSRAEYRQRVSEGSAKSTKPWEAMGISRRTYYYRMKRCTRSDLAPAAPPPDSVSTPPTVPAIVLPCIRHPIALGPTVESLFLVYGQQVLAGRTECNVLPGATVALSAT
jgi:hypothetical protein